VVDEIPSHVIEPAIMRRLPEIFDPSKISQMSEDIIDAIGGESKSKRVLRASLQAKVDVFAKSSMICRMYSDATEHAGSAPEAVVPGNILPQNLAAKSTVKEVVMPWLYPTSANETSEMISAITTEGDHSAPVAVPPKGKKAKAAKAKELLAKDGTTSGQV
jgi:hypothetical protein